MSGKGAKKAARLERALPKRAALIVGSGYGSLKIAEDLSSSGVPVVWVTRARHFLELPAGLETYRQLPDDINFQFRPLYLRVTRHPLVTPLTRARIESIEETPEGAKVVIAQAPQYIDYDRCTGCQKCVKACPLNDSGRPPLTSTPNYCPSRALQLDKRKLPPCREACPLGVNVQAYLALAAAGRFDEALAIIREVNPLPGVCGRVCHHPCEEACRRRELDQPLAIRGLKRFLADRRGKRKDSPPPPASKPWRREKIAIIGSGPAGLTAAHFLSRAGFPVTIFEARSEPGGMLRWGIPAYRLPREALADEIQEILDGGVELRAGVRVGQDVTFAELAREYQSLFLAVGAQQSHRLGVPGEETSGVLGAVEMLRAFHLGDNLALGKSVAVVGGGNSAIDAARTAVRIGADAVTIYYRRERQDMPAGEDEIQAAEAEGVKIEYLVGPARVVEANGRVAGLELIRMKPGEVGPDGRRRPGPISGSEFQVAADTVISAIGQRPVLDFLPADGGVKVANLTIAVDERLRTDRPDILAGGDVVTGPGTVIEAMAQGRIAAEQIMERLTGTPAPELTRTLERREGEDFPPISEAVAQEPRQEMAQRQPKARRRDFQEVDLGLSEAQAMAEAKRCLQCGVCCECQACLEVCGEIQAIDHFRSGGRFELIAPAVVVTDDQELPEHASSLATRFLSAFQYRRSGDIMDELVGATAVAGLAMEKVAPLRVKILPEPPPPLDLPLEPRVGFFICACNGTMASSSVLEKIQDLARRLPGIEHVELLDSVCNPAGAEAIAATVAKKNLSRMVVASCMCCPLEFYCIACNDQRARAKLLLFDRLGLPRSRFEMINYRDNLSRGKMTEEQIVDRARAILRSALVKSKYTEPLRQGITHIGKNILVLGGSEIGVSCARNLAIQGFSVRLVHRPAISGQAPPAAILARELAAGLEPSIQAVAEATIEKIQGGLGDFHVSASVAGARKRWKADIVCLTDEHMVPLSISEKIVGLTKLYRHDFSFFHTPVMGLYRVMPRTIKRVNEFEAGAALAAEVATTAAEAFLKDHQLSPMVDPERCRGCGRCVDICPFKAVELVPNQRDGYVARVVYHNCVGCGGCVGRCPVTAMNMPYYSNQLLKEIVEDMMSGVTRDGP